MADYDLEAKITADASGYEAGVKKAEKASKKLSTSVSKVIQGLGKNGLVGALGAVGLASQGLTSTLGAVVKIARKVSATINECTEAYKGQVIAEKALNTAIQNNPFITGASSKALLQFVSDMQKVSNYGDDELIPMMTNLISLGRTETETMQIMSVAMDMSAGMGISLDTAITQLNATLNGNIGRLGQQNAELKDLTEEELRNGKAIEILGEKFKGLSSATADTSKQLQNIKGDFKEALGQFTLPSSDIWNKFWLGFYEKGIEIINKLDAYMDAEILGKKLSKALEEQVKKIKNEGEKGSYLRGALDLVTDSELQYLNDYLSGLRKANKDQQKILEFVRKEQEARKFVAEEEARFAKLKADRLKQEEEEKRLAEEKAKKEKELAELREKQLQIQKEWEDKLFAIRIENLERQRDLELDNAELTEEQKIAISEFYGEQILAMKIKQIEKERDEALKGENVTEEAREKIRLYYESKITQIKQDEEKKRYKAKKEELKEEEKAEKATFTIIIKNVYQTTKKISNAFESVSTAIKKIFSGIGGIVKNTFNTTKDVFSKLFAFNMSDSLEALLTFEDAILTFFVETLPKLPSFMESAFNSIAVLIDTLFSTIDFRKLKDILETITKTFVNLAPQIVSGITSIVKGIAKAISSVFAEDSNSIINALGHMFFTVVEAVPEMITNALGTMGNVTKIITDYITTNSMRIGTDVNAIVSSIVQSIADFISNGGWQSLLNAIYTLFNAITNAIINNAQDVVNAIIEGLPDLFDTITNAFRNLGALVGKLLRPLIQLLFALTEALIEFALSDEFIDTLVDLIVEVIEIVITEVIPLTLKLIPKLITAILKFVLKELPKMVFNIVKGLINAFVKTNWIKAVKDMFTGFIEGFKDFFGIHSPSTLFASFGEYMIQGLWEGISGLGDWLNERMSTLFNGMFDGIQNSFSGVGSWASGVWQNITSAFSNVGSWFSSTFSTAYRNMSNAFTNVRSWAGGVWSNIQNGFGNVGSWFSSTFSTAWTNIQNAFRNAGSWFSTLFNGIKNTISNIFTSLANILKTPINAIIRMLNTIIGAFNKLSIDIPDWVPVVGGKSFGVNIPKINELAIGTNSAQRGLTLVGEAGPELVNFRGGEQVLNNRNTNKALAEMGKASNTFNVTFNNLQDTTAFNMMQQLKAYNRQLAINGIV